MGNAEEATGLSGLDPVDGSTGAAGNELPNQPCPDPTLAVLEVVPRVYVGGISISPIGASRSGHSLGAQGISLRQEAAGFSSAKRHPRSLLPGALHPHCCLFDGQNEVTGGQGLWGKHSGLWDRGRALLEGLDAMMQERALEQL